MIRKSLLLLLRHTCVLPIAELGVLQIATSRLLHYFKISILLPRHLFGLEVNGLGQLTGPEARCAYRTQVRFKDKTAGPDAIGPWVEKCSKLLTGPANE